MAVAPSEGLAGSPNCGRSVPEPMLPTGCRAPEPNANRERTGGKQRAGAALQHTRTASAPGPGTRRRIRPDHTPRRGEGYVSRFHLCTEPSDPWIACSGDKGDGNDSGQHGKKSQDHRQCGGPSLNGSWVV